MRAPVLERLAEAIAPVDRHETHGSWVLVTADRAYKIKKPVVMPFLDYGTLERRRAMCRAEVEVNRRAAPDIYLGVRAIVPDGDGVSLASEDAPGSLEYAVEMRRFDEDRTLAALLAHGEATDEDVDSVGRALAAFHARSPVVEGAPGAEPVERTIDDDFASIGTLLGDDAAAQQRLVGARRFAAAFLGTRRHELETRARTGRVRDGHGDLRAEHVLVARRIELVDAIEFDPGLRRIDTGMDLAFLVMDLHAYGRPDLAAVLVHAYRDAGGDPGDDRLVAFFAAYRAQVRAKVALLRAAQLASAPAAAAARAEADALLALADRFAWTARGPFVLAVAGPSASGKTTLATALAAVSGRPHVSSDAVRKQLVGVAPTARAPEPAYGAEVTYATYRDLGQRAARPVGGAIVDATFRHRSDRDAFRAALGPTGLVFVECRAPRHVIAERAAARLADPERISDATPAIALHQLTEFEPFDEVPSRSHLMLRSDQPTRALVAEIADAIDRLGDAASPQH